MTLAAQITDYVNAAFTGLWVQTHEPDEAEREIARLAMEKKWNLAVWDVAAGIRIPGHQVGEQGVGDPLAALRALPALGDPRKTSALLILHNFHKFLNSSEVMQTTFSQLIAGKQQGTFLVVLSPIVQIPVELEKLFVVLEHELPGREQIAEIARGVSEEGDVIPDTVYDAAAGLTRYEAEGAFALSLAKHGVLRPEEVWELKAQTLKKANVLTLYRGREKFSDLGGLQRLKDFCSRALKPGKKVKARGVMLLGVPGTGKSALAKALGNETGRPTLLLDMGALYGSLVGSTEANVRQALKIADAMAPCILFVDEIEKALSGVGGQGDSGVSTRLFGTVLTWLSDHASDVFFICTANDVSRLPSEFSRAERFDAIYFIDLPTSEEKNLIWAMYRKQFEIDDAQNRPDDTDWTGAEVKACCRLAALLGFSLTQAAQNVVPVAKTAAESVDKLRTWASGRCLSASAPGIYHRDGSVAAPPTRRRINKADQN